MHQAVQRIKLRTEAVLSFWGFFALKPLPFPFKYLKCNLALLYESFQDILGVNTEFCHMGLSDSSSWAFALQDVLGMCLERLE